MSSKSLVSSRHRAFVRQEGRCHYCGVLMWEGGQRAFAQSRGLKLRSVRGLQCTAEHLQARQDGGSDAAANIVAACALCNRRRHRRARPLSPGDYRRDVARRIARGGWHTAVVFEAGLLRRPGTAAEPLQSSARAPKSTLHPEWSPRSRQPAPPGQGGAPTGGCG